MKMNEYYPKIRIVKTLKSIHQLSKECNMASSTATCLVNGKYAMNLDNPKHKKFYNALKKRAEEIDKLLKKCKADELIKIDKKIYRLDDILNNRVNIKKI